MADNPELLVDIQKYCQYPNVKQIFTQTAQELLKTIETETKEVIESEIQEIRRGFESAAPARVRTMSEEIVTTRKSKYDKLLKLMNKLVAIRNVDSNKIHIGILQGINFDKDRMSIESKIWFVGKDRKYVIVHSEESNKAAKSFGVMVKTKRVELAISRAELLSESDLYRWKKENLYHHARDISVQIPCTADPEIISELILSLDKNVINCRIKDIYKPNLSSTFLKVLLSVDLMGDKDPASVIRGISSILKRLGYSPLF